MGTKICFKCKIEKDIELFFDSKQRGGHYIKSSYCKDCSNKLVKERYHKEQSMIVNNGVIDLKGEKWVDIEGWENDYKISNRSRVKRLERQSYDKSRSRYNILKERLMSQTDNGQGYLTVILTNNGRTETHKIHRLMGKMFIKNPNNYPVINHKNGIKNDNRISNLEWCTIQHNVTHKYEILKYKHPTGINNKLSKSILVIHPDGKEEVIVGMSEAARILKLDAKSISNVTDKKERSVKGYKFKSL